MKKYAFFYRKNDDGVYIRSLSSSSYIQLDARRKYPTEREKLLIVISEWENRIHKIIYWKDFKDALDIADKIRFTI